MVCGKLRRVDEAQTDCEDRAYAIGYGENGSADADLCTLFDLGDDWLRSSNFLGRAGVHFLQRAKFLVDRYILESCLYYMSVLVTS